MTQVRNGVLSTVVRPATTAYRDDLAGRDQPFGTGDGGWITVATVLEHAAMTSEPERSELLRDAVEIASELVGEARTYAFAGREWEHTDPSPTDAIVLLSDDMEQAGAINLAAMVLDSLLAIEGSLSTLQQGRIVAKRARVEWKMGRLDEAADRYRYVGVLGRRTKNAELRARALIGHVALAQMRGNYPEMLRYARRGVRLADRAGLRRLAREAHNGLMIAAGVAQRADEALMHGWAVYQSSIGDAIDEGEVLQNLGQVLFDAGQVDAARAAFATVVSRQLPARILLPALGGLALASAASMNEPTLLWSATEVRRLIDTTVPRYALASALLECATALARIGRSNDAEACRRSAIGLANAHQFHEIAYRADALNTQGAMKRVRPQQMLAKRAAGIAREVEWMEPKRLPTHVALDTASV